MRDGDTDVVDIFDCYVGTIDYIFLNMTEQSTRRNVSKRVPKPIQPTSTE